MDSLLPIFCLHSAVSYLAAGLSLLFKSLGVEKTFIYCFNKLGESLFLKWPIVVLDGKKNVRYTYRMVKTNARKPDDKLHLFIYIKSESLSGKL